MKNGTKVKLAVLLAAAMVLGVASVGLGDVEYSPGRPSDGGVTAEVLVDPEDPNIEGYDTVKHGPPAEYVPYSLLDGAIQGEIYHFYDLPTGDPYGDKMAVSWSTDEDSEVVYRVVYVYIRGADCGNLYKYGDDQNEDSGLHAPVKGKHVHDIHHITFYYTVEGAEEPVEPDEPEQPEQPHQ